ncbi:hypothetical protein EG68_03725 [Paragonimus skrjabini miyazakii]|uniref:Major facilitator superfamily (MFS) profile domain-containing protein n=1 Tax=Paragonimus skrjabini miyazakii TaxID=59628 RepID=A0A8S9Z6Y4_9TREM|nr:hypothetical protein EG68_03725 [Paragonimus skrjabini miyazakii]
MAGGNDAVPAVNCVQNEDTSTAQLGFMDSTNEAHRAIDADVDQVNVDELLYNQVGACGLWQWMVVILCLLSSPSMATLPVFVNAVPSVRCRMEPEVEQMFLEKNTTFDQASALIGPEHGCARYLMNWTDLTTIIGLFDSRRFSNITQLEKCPHGYIYRSKQYQYTSTIVAEFDLVCDKEWIQPIGTFTFMFGMVVGYIIGGWCGDRYGRRPTALAFALLELVAAIGVSCAWDHHTFNITRALAGLTNTGKASIVRVLPLELTLAKYRGYFSSLITIGVLCFHRILLAGFAYFIPNWRWLNAAGMLPAVLCLLYFFLLPESPRWLNSQRRPKDALKVLQAGQKINQLCRKNEQKRFELDMHLQKCPVHAQSTKELTVSERTFRFPCGNVCKSLKPYLLNFEFMKALVISTLVNNAQFLSLFGILLYGRVIKDHVYLVTLTNSLNSLPGPIIASVVYRVCRFRRMPLMVCFGLALVCLLIGGLYTLIVQPTRDIVLNVCCNCALVLYSATMVMLAIYVAELFPSAVRTLATGIAAGLGRLGSSVSTFVNQLDTKVKHGTPIMVYAAAVAFQMLLLLFLRDTSGENLQDFEEKSNHIEVAEESEKHHLSNTVSQSHVVHL